MVVKHVEILRNMILFLCMLFAILQTRCANEQGKSRIDKQQSTRAAVIEQDSIPRNINFSPKNNYEDDKRTIIKIRNALYRSYKSAPDTIAQNRILDSASQVFTTYLVNSILPHWYGTEWDFNGYTSTPRRGVIACGYFISTTLKDMGLTINRYTLAKQTPYNEAKTIAIIPNEVLSVDDENKNTELKKLQDGLYFVGLNNHVGYLYICSNNIFFIHSNYIEGMVMIENIVHSKVFNSTNYYVSKITNNKNLLQKWLKTEELTVFTQ